MKNSEEFIKKHLNKIICGDALSTLKKFPDESIDCVVTSPPYWSLRDYGVNGQLGLETDFNEYLSRLITVFDEIKRILKLAGSCWEILMAEAVREEICKIEKKKQF
jgi:DNA modification methylase